MSFSLGNLSGVALVTGAGSGMGRACAKAFAEAGATVLCVDLAKEGLESLEQELDSRTGKIYIFAIDITNEEAVSALFRHILATYGRLDYAVNCAAVLGTPTLDFLAHTSPESRANFDFVLKVNVTAQIHLLREEISLMIQQSPIPSSVGRKGFYKGHIVNYISSAAFVVQPVRIPYSLSKHAMHGVSKSVAVGYASQGVHVNQIAPGYILTPMGGASGATAEQLAAHCEHGIPLKRGGLPEEAADVSLYLCSERSSYLVGETIHLDGGAGILG